MSNYPDWSSHGYQILSELGQNSLGGRVTYKAQQINTQQQVVIKQFQFAALGSTWAEYETCSQEMTLLQTIAHPNVPRYLDTFQTPNGLCMVQEYIEAQSLAVPRRWTPQDIKQVALSVLRILAYLQRQNPPIIHRDIKPENILIDEQLKVYLVDFGFARSGGGEVAASSVVKGTMGFMPPEQLFNRELTAASDLYGLGATLICLLTGTKSTDIGNLIDANYCLHFQHLVPPLKRGWVSWLQKMVAPRVPDRYANAAEALAALEPIDVDRLPKVRVGRDTLEFTSRQYGEKLTQTISISNPIPDTMLAGRWEVAPHPSDPPHTPYDHAWISFSPQKFEANEVECEIAVDTSQLLAGETYTREIRLRSNSSPETNTITVRVQTAPLPQPQKPAYLMSLGLSAIGWMPFLLANLFALVPVSWNSVFLLVWAFFLLAFPAWDKIAMATAAGDRIGRWSRFKTGMMGGVGAALGAMGGSSLGAFVADSILHVNVSVLAFSLALIGIAVGTLWGASWGARHKGDNIVPTILSIFFPLYVYVLIPLVMLKYVAGLAVPIPGLEVALIVPFAGYLGCEAIWRLIRAAIAHQIKRGFDPKDAAQVVLLSIGLGFCLTLVTVTSLSSRLPREYPSFQLGEQIVPVSLAIATVLMVSFLLGRLLIYRPFKHNKLINQYRHIQSSLIKP
jgi:serine/threonine protein kinase